MRLIVVIVVTVLASALLAQVLHRFGPSWSGLPILTALLSGAAIIGFVPQLLLRNLAARFGVPLISLLFTFGTHEFGKVEPGYGGFWLVYAAISASAALVGGLAGYIVVRRRNAAERGTQ